MRRTILAAMGCLASLLAGCGGSSKTPTSASGAGSTTASNAGPGALSHTGSVGTIGSSKTGSLSAKDPAVVPRIDSQLVSYYTQRGFTGVTAICSGSNARTASCKVTGTNPSGKTSSAVITLILTPTTGALKVTNVAP